MNGKHIISAAEAGVGFALSIVNAEKYNGQEIGSIQALMDAGVLEGQTGSAVPGTGATNISLLAPHFQNIANTFI